MTSQLFISILIALVLGWLGHLTFLRLKHRVKAYLPVVVPIGKTGSEVYQNQKAKMILHPIEPPIGTPPEAAERFRKLPPLVQHRVIEARRRLGLDNG